MENERIIPSHIAIILDGNRRWARGRNLASEMGHKAGADRLEDIAKYCHELGVKCLTVFAFSTENWRRSKEEVGYLMELLAKAINDFDKKYKDEDVRIKLVGDINGIPEKLADGIRRVENRTKDKTGFLVNVAINYGGRAEIIHAAKEIAKDYKEGKITSLDDINEELFTSYTYTNGVADPDLFIRTAGEIRTSGFLTWQSVYSEMYFTSVPWPDFTREELDKAIDDFNKRKRNFGK
jgi:undecaprenyl diphosphate synthase